MKAASSKVGLMCLGAWVLRYGKSRFRLARGNPNMKTRLDGHGGVEV